jgi:hypothetical protein
MQADFGYISPYFEGGISMRFCNVKFTELRDNYFPNVTNECTFFEPSIVGKVGGENVKFVMSMTFPTIMNGAPLFGYNTYVITMGIQGAISF